MYILVPNAGVSSVKYQLIDSDDAAIPEARGRRLARRQIERIGGEAIIPVTAPDRPPAVAC